MPFLGPTMLEIAYVEAGFFRYAIWFFHSLPSRQRTKLIYPLLVQPQTNYDQNTSWIRINEAQLKCLAEDQENAVSVRWHSFASWNSFRPLRLFIPVPKSAFSFHLLNNAHITPRFRRRSVGWREY